MSRSVAILLLVEGRRHEKIVHPKGVNCKMLFICWLFLLVKFQEILGLGISTNNLYCSEGTVKVNCLCDGMPLIHNNTKTNLSIKRNGLQQYMTKSLLSLEHFADVPFKLENGQTAADTLNYTCLWTTPQNNSIICEKKVQVKLKDLPRRPENVTLHFVYNKDGDRCLEVRFLNFSTSKIRYNIYGYDTYDIYLCLHEQSHIQWPPEPLQLNCPGKCKLFDGDIYFRKCYTVKVDAISDIGTCWTTPVSKQITFSDLYGGLRRFTVTNTDQTSISFAWENPRNCCTVVITPNLKFLFEVCGAGTCENHTLPYKEDTNKYKVEFLRPNTKYKIRMSVEYNIHYDLDFAAWTPTEETSTLNEVPSVVPGKLNCRFLSTEKSIKFNWMPPVGKFIGEANKYLLKFEQVGYNDTKVEVNSSVCHSNSSCSFTFKNIYIAERYRLSIRACSNGGCADNSKVGFCTLKRETGETSDYSEDIFRGYIVYGLISASALLLVLLLAWLIGFVKRKRRQQRNRNIDVTVIGPRPDIYHDYSKAQIKPLLYDKAKGSSESNISTSSTTPNTTLMSSSDS